MNIHEKYNLNFMLLGTQVGGLERFTALDKAMYGKKVRPCLRCNYCLHTSWLGKRTQCALNPEMGYEFEGGVQLASSK